MSDFVSRQIESLVHAAEPLLGTHAKEDILGHQLAKLAAPLMRARDVPVTAVLRLALLNDCLRVAERVVKADGHTTEAEVGYLYPMLRQIAPLLGRLRASYSEYARLAPIQARDLLEQHESDGQPFGGVCKRSEWAGFAACRHLARLSQRREPLRKYAALMSRLIEEVASHGGSTGAEEHVAARLREFVRSQTQIEEELEEGQTATEEESRARAFYAPDAPHVFHSVAHANELWERDPFDVELVHSAARQVFEETLDRAHDATSLYGKSLVLLGESGAGKTHLLRAFRASAHGTYRAYTGYVQLHVQTQDYVRLILRGLVNSMDRPYDAPLVTDSALAVLSDAVVARLAGEHDERIEMLRDAELSPEDLTALISSLADASYQRGLEGIHVDLVRAFLLLQRRDPALRQRVLKLLRCEPFSSHDQRLLCDISPWTEDTSPYRMLMHLGKLAWEASGSAILILLDQLEDLRQQDTVDARFRKLIDAVRMITDELPHSVVLLSTLDDFYTAYAGGLTASVRDRLDRDPAPERLTIGRTSEEIQEIVAHRMAVLYNEQGLEVSEDTPLYPFTAEALLPLRNSRARDIVEWCASYQADCKQAGALVSFGEARSASEPLQPPAATLDSAWQAALGANDVAVPEDDTELLKLIVWGFQQLAAEQALPASVKPLHDDAYLLGLGAAGEERKALVSLNNRAPQGGHLGRQLEKVAHEAGELDAQLVLLRSGEFPNRRGSRIAAILGNLIRDGALTSILNDDELRTIAALQQFQRSQDPEAYGAWVSEAGIVQSLKLYQPLLAKRQTTTLAPVALPPMASPTQASSKLETAAASPARLPVPPPMARDRPADRALSPKPDQASMPAPSEDGLALGRGIGLREERVSMLASSVTGHIAVVGATGSGKTTLALNLIEQLMEQGTPVLMLDRKGDLGTYGDPSFWAAAGPSPERDAAKVALRRKVDVQIFTPGDSDGRPLSIQLAPAGLADLSRGERRQAANHAAAALASMLSIKVQPSEQKLAILAKGIELLAEGGTNPSLANLGEIIRGRDPDLMNQVGTLGAKHFDVLAERLASLEMLNAQLFDSTGDALSGDILFGRGRYASPGKTKLSIISTKALAGEGAAEFWVTQLLGELLAWTSRNPSPTLQAVVFLDEADLYLPATRKPSSKEPLISLLKRGRSAGLGIMLATQNPGDFDYKARANLNTWFLGRVSQVNDIRRMQPLLSEARTDLSGKLANAQMGEFYQLSSGRVTPFRAQQSLMKTRQLSEREISSFAKQSAQGRAQDRD